MPLNLLISEAIRNVLAGDSGLTTSSGSTTETTGSMTAGTKTLTVASTTSYSAGHGILITDAGTAGSKLPTWIESIAGSVFTLHDQAVNTVSGVVVEHDDRAIVPANNILPAFGNLPLKRSEFPAIRITQSGAIGNDFPDSDRGEFTFYVYYQSEPGGAGGQVYAVLSLISGRIRDLLHSHEGDVTNSSVRSQILREQYRSPIMVEPDIPETTHFQALRYEYLVNVA